MIIGSVSRWSVVGWSEVNRFIKRDKKMGVDNVDNFSSHSLLYFILMNIYKYGKL